LHPVESVLGGLDQLPVDLKVVHRHASGAEALFETLPYGCPRELDGTFHSPHGTILVLHDKARRSVLHHFADGPSIIGDHRCPARHGFDHHEAEGFRPIQRCEQRERSAEEFRFFPVADLADVLGTRRVEQGFDFLREVVAVHAVDLCRDLQR